MEATDLESDSTKSNQPISQADEIKVVALLARGTDSHKKIAEQVGISASSVRVIRDRNQEALGAITGELIERKTKQAKRLLDKSHDLIERRLDSETSFYDQRQILREQLENNDITYTEYKYALRGIPNITLAELTTLSKEMFNQSQIEEGKPTSIGLGAGANAGEAAKKLDDLITALHSNDEVKLLEMLHD